MNFDRSSEYEYDEKQTPLDYALEHAAQGIPVFPCSWDKVPLVAKGLYAVTCNEDKVIGWWNDHPDAEIPNYEQSRFLENGPLACDEEELLRIVSEIHPLEELVDESQFKPYEQLRQRFEQVTRIAVEPPAELTGTSQSEAENDAEFDPEEVNFSAIFGDNDCRGGPPA